VVGDVVGDLDLLRHRVPARNTGIARVQRRVVNPPALRVVEPLARKPVVPPARLSLRTIWTVVAGLAADVGAGQLALREAVFGCLFLRISGQIPGRGEFVDEGLVLADAVREHAAVVAVVVETPLHIDDVAGLIGRNGGLAPDVAGLVVVDGYASIVAAGARAADEGGVEGGPGSYRLEDSTFGAGVFACATL
jgi:hypothetical protein